VRSHFESSLLLSARGNPEIFWQFEPGRFRVRQHDLRQRKRMDGSNEDAPAWLNPETR
jgi:hypothetical protein